MMCSFRMESRNPADATSAIEDNHTVLGDYVYQRPGIFGDMLTEFDVLSKSSCSGSVVVPSPQAESLPKRPTQARNTSSDDVTDYALLEMAVLHPYRYMFIFCRCKRRRVDGAWHGVFSEARGTCCSEAKSASPGT